MFNLLGAEFFKLRKRRLPYVLLLVMLASILLPVVLNYINYNDTLKKYPELTDIEIVINPDGSSVVAGLPSLEPGSRVDEYLYIAPYQLARWKETLVLPGAMKGIFSSVMGLGMFLVIVLTASIIGNEYGWGTIRQAIARGNSRLIYFTAKFVTVVISTAVGVVCAVLAGLIATIITSLLVEGSIEWAGFAGYFFTPLGTNLLVVTVYLAMAAFFAVALRSATAGMAVAITWFLGESIVLALLSMSTGSLAGIGEYFITYNTNQLMSLSLAEGGDADPWKAVAILLAYIAVFTVGAYQIFRRQDLTA